MSKSRSADRIAMAGVAQPAAALKRCHPTDSFGNWEGGIPRPTSGTLTVAAALVNGVAYQWQRNKPLGSQ